ncbi:MAG: RsmB/NOP family class I SAM-dependent RNA methyltransferase [Planctomycetota bacterium]
MTRTTRAVLDIVAIAVRAVDGGKRADQVLSRILRDRKDLDEPTRATVHRATMALFRWWGWVEAHGQQSIARSVGLALLLQHKGEIAADPFLADLAKAARLDLAKIGPSAQSARLSEKAAWLAELVRGKVEPLHLFPDWLPKHLPEMEAPAREALFDSLQHLPSLWIRAQGKEASGLVEVLRATGFQLKPHAVLDRAIEVLSGGDLYRTEPFKAGRYEVQDVASQAVVHATGAARGEAWWDACAGAGGKTLALADRMHGGGTVLATDTHTGRLGELGRRARRAGLSNIRPVEWDGKALPGPAKRGEGFHGVLVDAPCSASGTWRRSPDARWRTPEAAVKRLAALAKSLLALVAPCVRSGGRLIYATCSLSRLENEEVVEAFLGAHPEFAPDPVPHPLTGAATSGVFRILPEESGGDGMFIARLRRAPAK